MNTDDLHEDFMDLFLTLADNNGYLSARCDKCDSYVQTDLAPNRYSIQTIKQVMKLFYTTQLQYDTIPWSLCECCYTNFCPGCTFDIISTTIASGMLTAHCPKCNQDYSYSDIMDAEVFGEVIVFSFN